MKIRVAKILVFVSLLSLVMPMSAFAHDGWGHRGGGRGNGLAWGIFGLGTAIVEGTTAVLTAPFYAARPYPVAQPVYAPPPAYYYPPAPVYYSPPPPVYVQAPAYYPPPYRYYRPY